ncbi:type II toxin-antitoxin system PemK/MazF family toxin [Hamadaea tsunoensis]|uniref:type II toxin-antitoxin system PemK/MazF family toxin n=1 Tax=Hamadaea tsunoensis TaxID=53368 RepID=UPI000419A31C|nr:type II toxin-antitoxin system PemK/MazF family toxin [Hamadaea tsunoensis]
MIWWLLLAVVVIVVAVVLLRRPATSRRRPVPKAPPRRPAPPRRAPTLVGTPRPGEIWWADVPYEDGTGHKIRPCLVLRGGGKSFEVLKITSQDQSDRTDHVQIPTKAWDPGADHNSWLDLTGPIRVQASSFEDKAGLLDATIWRKVRRLHNV